MKKIVSFILICLMVFACPMTVNAAKIIEDCYICEKTGKCDLCYGNSTSACDGCEGAGRFLCDNCNGEKREVYGVCNGQKFFPCNCDGKADCPSCYGASHIACNECNGEGYITCRRCMGVGIVTCDTCEATGIVYCQHCLGSGKCPNCKGTGYNTCPGWDGGPNDGIHNVPKKGDLYRTANGKEYIYGSENSTVPKTPAEAPPAAPETPAEAPPTATEHTHTWDARTVITEATHQTDGLTTYTCTDCGETKNERVPAINHTFSSWTLINGEFVRTCDCGERQTKQIDTVAEVKDEKTGISISTDETASLLEGTSISGEDITKKMTHEERKTIEAAIRVIGNGDELLSVFNISLEFDNVKIQPDGMVKVELPMPRIENGKEFRTYKVVYIDDEVIAHDMPTEIKDDKIIFTTNHFSCYAIVGVNTPDKASPSEIPTWRIAAIVGAGVIVAAGIAALIANKKKKAQ